MEEPKVPSEAREARSAGAPRGWGLGRGAVAPQQYGSPGAMPPEKFVKNQRWNRVFFCIFASWSGLFSGVSKASLGTIILLQDGPKKTKLLYFVHIFAKYWPILTIFSPVDSVRNLLLSDMHITSIMSLHYLVKHKYPKTNNIVQSLVVTTSVMGKFKEIPLLESLKLTVLCS